VEKVRHGALTACWEGIHRRRMNQMRERARGKENKNRRGYLPRGRGNIKKAEEEGNAREENLTGIAVPRPREKGGRGKGRE